MFELFDKVRIKGTNWTGFIIEINISIYSSKYDVIPGEKIKDIYKKDVQYLNGIKKEYNAIKGLSFTFSQNQLEKVE